MGNKVRFGIEQVHIAFLEDDGKSWGAVKPIRGVVGFTATPDGGESVFYADNIKYYVRQTNNGYTGELEAALIPDEIIAEMLGWEIDPATEMLVEVAEGKPKAFALMGQIQGDALNRRFIYYHCTASRPTQASPTTTDTITPTTETLSLVILPFEDNGKKIVKAVIEPTDQNMPIYTDFFTTVTLPGASALPVNTDALDAAIAIAGELVEMTLVFTEASLETLNTALTAAQGLVDPTQAQVNEATAALNAAITGLKPL